MSNHDRALFLVVTIKPRLDRRDEAESQLQMMRRNSVQEPGCVFMHFVQPHDDPDTWLMLEMFRSRAAWDEHMRQPYVTEGNRVLEDLLREPSDLRLGDAGPRGPAARAVGSSAGRRETIAGHRHVTAIPGVGSDR